VDRPHVHRQLRAVESSRDQRPAICCLAGLANCWPASISGSHQTDQPRASIAATIGATRALSLRA
jgi:hypothetical protein